MTLVLPMFANNKTYAECRNLLPGMVSWDCHVELYNVNSESALSQRIWTIAANVLTDITVIASYAALGFVIYGGYLYMFSAGDPGKAASGKKTLINAFIGIAAAAGAGVIFGTIRAVLIGGENDLEGVSANDIITNLISWVIGIGGVIAAIFLVYGGISYITASGDAGKLTKAKNAILYSLIGLAIVALSEVILNFVINSSNNAADDAQKSSYTSSIILAKEANEK